MCVYKCVLACVYEYACVHISAYVYMCISVCRCICVYLCLDVYICTDACMFISMYIWVYLCMCSSMSPVWPSVGIRVHVCVPHVIFPFHSIVVDSYSFLLDWGARDPGPILVWVSFRSGSMSRIAWSDGVFSLVQDSVLSWQQQRVLNPEQKPNTSQLELSSGRRRLCLDLCRAGGCRAEPRCWEVLWGHMTA